MIRKRSKKRQAILDVLCATDAHPNAEWVYQTLKPQYPDLSLGTVYRNLALFKKEGRIACVATVNGQERYDADTSAHTHFICSHCGDVLDIKGMDGVVSDEVVQGVRESTGALVDGFRLDFHGLCRQCGLHRA